VPARVAAVSQGGLTIPAGAASSAEIPVGVVASLGELGLGAQPLEVIRHALAGVPFEPAMRYLAQIAAEIHHHPTDPPRHRALDRRLFGDGEIVPLLLEFLAEPGHVLLDGRIVSALQRLLITDGSPDPGDLSPTHCATLLFGLLGLVDALPDASPPEAVAEADDVNGPEPWLPFVVQLGCAAASDVYVLEGVARAHAMYRVFAHDEQSREHDQYVDIDALLEDAGGGLTADEQLAVGLAILAGTSALKRNVSLDERSAVQISPTYLKDTLLATRSSEALAMLTADRRWFVNEIDGRNEDPMDLAWDHTLFESRPVLRLDDGSGLLIGPGALTAWMGRGMHYRALAAAQRTDDPAKPGQPMSRRFLNFTGTLGERYVRSLVERSLDTAVKAGAVVVSGDQPYKIRRQELRAPDVAVASGPDLVLIEVRHGRLSRAARTATDPESVRSQVDKLVTKKLVELHNRIADLLSPDLQLELEGIDRSAVRRVLPVLVLSGDALTVESVLFRYVSSVRPGMFADARVQMPVITDLDGLEKALALCEHHGHTLAELLTAFVAETGAQVPLINWITQRYHPPADLRPSYVETMFDAAMEPAGDQLFSGAVARWRARRDGASPGLGFRSSPTTGPQA
jgi:hypothetical protein